MKFCTITTPRLIIRTPRLSDAPKMHEGLKQSFEELKKWMPWAQHLASLSDTEYFIKESQRVWDKPPQENVERPLVIFDREDKNYIGATGIKPLNLLVPSFEVGYWVAEPHKGHGYITEALNALCRYLFCEHHANRVEINCELGNTKSCGVPERLKFHKEGVLKNNRMAANNRSITSTVVYALTSMSQLPECDASWES